ncbi:hypothetical protein ACWIGI_34620 [Nocardia sp. NPDC055321]
MIEVWGRRVAIRYDRMRLYISPLQQDASVPIDIGLADLLRVRTVLDPQGRPLLLLFPRSPHFGVNGIALQRHPIPIALEPELGTQIQGLVAAIENDLRALRRVSRPRRDLTPPHPVASPAGSLRPDVHAAADRMHDTGSVLDEIAIVHASARPDEYVLDMAAAIHSHDSVQCVVVVSTVRLMAVSTSKIRAIPVGLLDRSEVTGDAAAAVLGVRVQDHVLQFHDMQRRDARRVALGLEVARDIARFDGSIEMACPSSAQLFGEWQLLTERRRLGMVPDDRFQHEAVGIMVAADGH